MDAPTLKLAARATTGKKVKRLRRDGIVPVHMYGGTITPSTLQVDVRILRRVLPQVGRNVPLTVEVDGQNGDNICFVREVQRHPVTEEILHVDFLRVEATQQVSAEVPLVLAGEAPAVRNLGGTLVQPLQALLVEALPMDMPASFEVDVSGLEDFEKTVRVSDVAAPSGVTFLTDAEEMIARVMPPRVEEEVEVEAEEEGLEEGEVPEGEEAEGEAPAEAGSDSA